MPLNQRMGEGNVVHLHNGVLLSGKKSNDIVKFAGEWKKLDKIILSEVTDLQRQTQYVFTHK